DSEYYECYSKSIDCSTRTYVAQCPQKWKGYTAQHHFTCLPDFPEARLRWHRVCPTKTVVVITRLFENHTPLRASSLTLLQLPVIFAGRARTDRVLLNTVVGPPSLSSLISGSLPSNSYDPVHHAILVFPPDYQASRVDYPSLHRSP